MDILPSECIKMSKLFLTQKSFCVWRVSKNLKKNFKIFLKILNLFSGNQFSLLYLNCAIICGPSDHSGGPRDQNLMPPPPLYKVGLIKHIRFELNNLQLYEY